MDIHESDWRVFRRLHSIALERFSKRVLEEVREAAACETDYHDWLSGFSSNPLRLCTKIQLVIARRGFAARCEAMPCPQLSKEDLGLCPQCGLWPRNLGAKPEPTAGPSPSHIGRRSRSGYVAGLLVQSQPLPLSFPIKISLRFALSFATYRCLQY